MDEATSNLDMKNELAINENLKLLNITKIMVAHRKETIRIRRQGGADAESRNNKTPMRGKLQKGRLKTEFSGFTTFLSIPSKTVKYPF